MAEVHRLSGHRREFLTDGERSALRATWHSESGYIVISLWRGDTCVATSHLTPNEAGRLSRFITGGLADMATENLASSRTVVEMQPGSKVSPRLRAAIEAWRESVAWSLESIARRLR